jgi:hypothetical protein
VPWVRSELQPQPLHDQEVQVQVGPTSSRWVSLSLLISVVALAMPT